MSVRSKKRIYFGLQRICRNRTRKAELVQSFSIPALVCNHFPEHLSVPPHFKSILNVLSIPQRRSQRLRLYQLDNTATVSTVTFRDHSFTSRVHGLLSFRI